MGFTAADAYEDTVGDLAAYERTDRKEPSWRVTWPEAKLLFITSTGFFIDAYDLFSINLVIPILNYEYNGKLSSSINNIALKGGVLKAAANLGCVPGQVMFGLLGDVYGRKFVYGKELMILMLGTILTISAPNSLSPVGVFTWITCFRVLMGIGIGGDYPMSASIVSDRSNVNRRGVMLSFIFSMQGWGNFCAGIVSIVVLSIFKHSVNGEGHTGKLDGVWRVIVGIVLIPCLGTIYQRLTLPESAKMKNALAVRDNPGMIIAAAKAREAKRVPGADVDHAEAGGKVEEHGKGVHTALVDKRKAFTEFIEYFSEWRHLKILLGTALSWFLPDMLCRYMYKT